MAIRIRTDTQPGGVRPRARRDRPLLRRRLDARGEASGSRKLLPHERLHAAFDGDAIVGGAGAFPFELTIPGGQLPVRRRDRRRRAADAPPAGDPRPDDAGAARRHPRARRAARCALGLGGDDLRALRLRARRAGRDGAGVARPRRAAARSASAGTDCAARRPRRGACGPSRASTTASGARRPASSRARATGGSCASSTTARSAGVGPASSTACCSSSTAGRPGTRSTASSSSSTMPTNMSQVRVIEAIGDSPAATRELWRYLLAIDWVARDRAAAPARRPPALPARPASEPPQLEGLRRALAPPPRRRRRAARPGRSRPTVASRSTSRRPDVPGERRHLDARSRLGRPLAAAAPIVRLDVQALASAYLGGFTFADLARAGRVEEAARGGIARADALFRVDAKPWCPEIF